MHSIATTALSLLFLCLLQCTTVKTEETGETQSASQTLLSPPELEQLTREEVERRATTLRPLPTEGVEYPIALDHKSMLSLLPTRTFLVLFYSPRCPHSREFLPRFLSLGREHWQRVSTGMVDCSLLPSLCDLFQVDSLPTLQVIHKNSRREYIQSRGPWHVLRYFENELETDTEDDIPLFKWNNRTGRYKFRIPKGMNYTIDRVEEREERDRREIVDSLGRGDAQNQTETAAVNNQTTPVDGQTTLRGKSEETPTQTAGVAPSPPGGSILEASSESTLRRHFSTGLVLILVLTVMLCALGVVRRKVRSDKTRVERIGMLATESGTVEMSGY